MRIITNAAPQADVKAKAKAGKAPARAAGGGSGAAAFSSGSGGFSGGGGSGFGGGAAGGPAAPRTAGHDPLEALRSALGGESAAACWLVSSNAPSGQCWVAAACRCLPCQQSGRSQASWLNSIVQSNDPHPLCRGRRRA